MKKLIIFLSLLILSINSVLANSIPIQLTPLDIGGDLCFNCDFTYRFKISNDNLCSNILLDSGNLYITTNKYGWYFYEFDISSLGSTIPNYLCEYKNGALRKIHSYSAEIFNDIRVNNISSRDWSNVTITENQISDLQNYILTSSESFLNVNNSNYLEGYSADYFAPNSSLSNYIKNNTDGGYNAIFNKINITQGDYSIYSAIFDWTGLGVLDVIELVGEIGTLWVQDGLTIRGKNNNAKLTFFDSADAVDKMDSSLITYFPNTDELRFTDASGGYSFDENVTTPCITLDDGETYCTFATTFYNATQYEAIVGTIDGGTIVNTQHLDGNYDGITFNFSEASGSPALDLRVNFTYNGLTEFNGGLMRYKTSSLSGAYPIIQLWNYVDKVWEDYPPVSSSPSYTKVEQSVSDYTEHINELGSVQMRIYKASNGNINNHYYVDWIAIYKGYGVPNPTVDLTPYWRAGNTEESRNFTTTGNVTTNYFFGNGKYLTGIPIYNSSYLTYTGVTSNVDLNSKNLTSVNKISSPTGESCIILSGSEVRITNLC